MTGRVRSVTGSESLTLTDWRVCALAPGAADGPEALEGARWIAAPGPMTAAAMLRAAGAFDLDGAARRLFSWGCHLVGGFVAALLAGHECHWLSVGRKWFWPGYESSRIDRVGRPVTAKIIQH